MVKLQRNTELVGKSGREREGEVGFLVSASYGPLKINKFKPTDLDSEWGNSLQLQLTSQIKSSFESEIFISISFPLIFTFLSFFLSFSSLSPFLLVIFYPFFPIFFVRIAQMAKLLQLVAHSDILISDIFFLFFSLFWMINVATGRNHDEKFVSSFPYMIS